MSNPNNYTVGWICAITTEYVAAQEFLDDEHEGPDSVSPNDDNHYTLGRIGSHNVVVAVLPDSEYGKSSAAGVARDMMHSFPNVRIGLMVGIGGGAPGKHDIRLGDVVVSSGTNHGGVLGYDFGKDIQGQDFQMTGFLNQPPTLLRAAMSGLKARYERKGHRLSETVNTVLDKNKRLQKKYKQPALATDKLFKPGITHDSSCAELCRYDATDLVLRPDRAQDEDTPVIHYGLIASADKLMKNALERDKLSEEHNVLCFETEAAGLMNQFPCLVIRGICDYSDSHKNKEWQGYAAMVAAAYAKDLLYQIAPNRLEAERKISDILSVFQEVAKEHRNIAMEQLQAQKDLAQERLSEEQHRCHQLFRLTNSSNDAAYEWYKARVEERVEDTCMWFLKHRNFQAWLNQDSGPLLVSADPGCGKSVLAKYLIDHGLPRSANICYFFFKDQDQNTVRQALCALLHQLLSLKPCLIEHVMPQFRENGQGLINSPDLLWEILQNAVQDPRAGHTIVVLDALDECADSEFVDLMRNVQAQFRSDEFDYGRLRYLLTCRPYDQILARFQVLLKDFPNIHIPGEEESEAISQEVDHVIKRRVDQLAIERRLSPQIKASLEKGLQSTGHRTYLWVYLVFDYLAGGNFKRTSRGILSAIASLPRTVNEAYEQILNKTNESPIVWKALCIVLAARRPLTLSEMNVAVNVEESMESMADLDLEDDEDFKRRLRSWCGLFISVHQGCIYFLHQTAREFLLADSKSSTSISSGLRWHQSITNRHAHNVLATVCVLYLNLFNSKHGLSEEHAKLSGFLRSQVSMSYSSNQHIHDPISIQHVDRNSFLTYSSVNWTAHFRKANMTDAATIIHFARRLCDTSSRSYSIWFDLHRHVDWRGPAVCTDLVIASYTGLSSVVKLLILEGVEIDSRGRAVSLTSLSWAASKGHVAVVKLLLENGANVNSGNGSFIKGPLYLAAEHGHESVAKLLLQSGAYVNMKSTPLKQTPLHIAAGKGHDAVTKLLLREGADVEAKDDHGWTPLFKAISAEHETTVKLLIEEGADIDFINEKGTSPLTLAAGGEYNAYSQGITKLLIESGAFLEHDNIYGIYTPLRWASEWGEEATVRLLLDNGACVESRDKQGQTALSRAYRKGHNAIVNLLVERGARFDG